MGPGVGPRGWRQDALSKDSADSLGYQNILPPSATTGAQLPIAPCVYLLTSLPASHDHVQPPFTSGSVFMPPNIVSWAQRAWSHLHALEVTAPPPPVLPREHQFHVLHDSQEKGIEKIHMCEVGEGGLKSQAPARGHRT